MNDFVMILIQSSILIIALLLVRKLFLGRINPILQYSLWGIVGLRLFVPINIESVFSIFNVAKPQEIERVVAPVIYRVVQSGSVTQNVSTPPSAPVQTISNAINAVDPVTNSISTSQWITGILFAVWVFGMAAMLIYTFVVNIKFYRYVKKNGVKENDYYICPNITSPCLMGRKIVLNTKAADDERAKQYALLHEQTHLKHWDNIWAALRTLACIVYWFNPLVWLAGAVCRKDQELACDYSVIKQIGEDNRKEYGQVLISLIRKNKALPALTTAMANNKKDIKQRLKLIANRPKMLKITAIILTLVVVAVSAIACTGALTQTVDPDHSANSFSTKQNLESAQEDSVIEHYKSLGTFKGLDLFVFEQDGELYYGLRMGTNRMAFDDELEYIRQNPVDSATLKEILLSYPKDTFVILLPLDDISEEAFERAKVELSGIDMPNLNLGNEKISTQDISAFEQYIHTETLQEHRDAPPPDNSQIEAEMKARYVTAYTYTGRSTTTGVTPRIGTVASNFPNLPQGTIIYVPGYGYGIVEEQGAASDTNEIYLDLYMNSKDECQRWGRKSNYTFYVLGRMDKKFITETKTYNLATIDTGIANECIDAIVKLRSQQEGGLSPELWLQYVYPFDDGYLALAQRFFDGEVFPELYYVVNGSVVAYQTTGDVFCINYTELNGRTILFGSSFAFDNKPLNAINAGAEFVDGNTTMIKFGQNIDMINHSVSDSSNKSWARQYYILVNKTNAKPKSIYITLEDKTKFYPPKEYLFNYCEMTKL